MNTASLYTFFGSLRGRFLLHLLFWMGVTAFLVFLFGRQTEDYRYSFLFVCVLMPVAIGTTYLINYFLIPRYLLKRRYLRFGTYFIFAIIISVWAEMLVMLWALVALANYRYSNMNPLTGDIFFLAVTLYLVVFFSSSVKLLKHWYRGQQHISELRSQQLEAELKLKEAELQLLKGQIHPHFLFNTINNLYGLALEKSDRMPDAILRLSGLLDALLYRSHAPQVPLAAELKLIEDYVELENLRFEDRLTLKWSISGAPEAWAIAPFLLFPFLENAFKHGFAGETKGLSLQVEGQIRAQQLLFTVTNSVGATGKQLPSAGGIGLKNVKKRLELLYPGRHQLLITPTANCYKVELQLQLTPLAITAYASA